MLAAYIAGGVVGTMLLGFVIFKIMWRVAEPNGALIVSGSRHSGPDEGMGTGRGTS